MANDTRLNLSREKFQQNEEDVLNLSGDSRFFGNIIVESGGTLSFKENVGNNKILISDNNGVLSLEEIPDVENITKLINKSNHNFIIGDVIGWSGGTYNKAIGDGTYDGEVVGIVSKIIDINNFNITISGYIDTFSGLTINSTHFLSSDEYGKLQTIKPTGNTQLVKPILIADSSSSGWVLPYNGYINEEIDNDSESITKYINQTNHGFVVNDVIGWNGGVYDKAIADDIYNGEVIGVVSSVIDNNYFYLTQSGYISGFTGLTTNSTYFLSDSVAGAMQTTKPTNAGYMVKAIMVADSPNSAWVLPYTGHVIESGDTTGARKFTDLVDVPSTYNDNANRFVRVNEFADGLIFSDTPTVISESTTKTIYQDNHGFSLMDVIGWSGGTYNKAIANGTYNGEVIGIVGEVFDVNTFNLTTSGFVSGFTGLITNSTYYLSDIDAGELITTQPTTAGHVVKTVLIASSETTAWVLPYVGYILDEYENIGSTTAFTGLTDTPNTYEEGKWLKVSGNSIVYVNAPNGGNITGATNGLSVNSTNNVVLGGGLTGNTSIDVSNSNFYVTGNSSNYINGFRISSNGIDSCVDFGVISNTGIQNGVQSSYDYIGMYRDNLVNGDRQGIAMNDGYSIEVCDDFNNVGMVYHSDYSSIGRTNPRWIPDNAYITGLTSGGTGVSTFIGLTDTPNSYEEGKWLKVSGNSLVYIDAPSGGTTSPAGVDTSVQYNDNGVFGGVDKVGYCCNTLYFKWDDGGGYNGILIANGGASDDVWNVCSGYDGNSNGLLEFRVVTGFTTTPEPVDVLTLGNCCVIMHSLPNKTTETCGVFVNSWGSLSIGEIFNIRISTTEPTGGTYYNGDIWVES